MKVKTALTVAKHMSFSEAAFELSFSTSAVSKQVAALEQELDFPLFIRNGKSSISLTPNGERILPYLQKIVDSYESMDRERISLLIPKKSLVIGAPPTFPQTIISELISQFLLDHPSHGITEVRQENDILIEMLYHGKIDIAVIPLLGSLEDNPEFQICANDQSFVTIPLMCQQEYVLLNENHPLAHSSSVSIADLCNNPETIFIFISHKGNKMSVRQKIFLRFCAQSGWHPIINQLNLERCTAMDVASRWISSDPRYVMFTATRQEFPGISSVFQKENIFNPVPMVCYLLHHYTPEVAAFAETAQMLSHQYITTT